MTDLVFIWGMITGGALVGVLSLWRGRVQRRKLRAAEAWIAELEKRAEDLWWAAQR